MMHDVKMGKRTRQSFSKISEVLEMPDLIEVQKNSYYRFLKEDLKEVFHDISPIVDFSGKLVLEFVDYRIDLDKPKYSIEESKNRDVNYAAPLRVTVRLINRETGEVKQQEIFMGDFPLMTPQGTFIINGAERVIVSQLVRSPGAYYSSVTDKMGNPVLDENGQPKMRRRRLLRGIHLSGLFMFDADKLTIDPYKVYQRTLAPGFPWKVRLAHKTSSGHGLRLVCEIRVELGNIADNQICLARDLQLMGVLGSTGKPVVDDSCIDASRISYACRREDIYFIDEENLF